MPSKSSKVVVGLAAAAAIGSLFTPAPAQADYDCYEQGGYQFAGGEVVIVYPETGAETRFNAPRGLSVDAPAETFYENGTSLTGRVTGNIEKGGNVINLTVTRGPKYPPLILGGAAGPDNTPQGAFQYENHDSQLWESPTELACVPGSPPPIPDEFRRKPSATVSGGPADVFNIAHNDVPDPATGIQGAKIATLPDGASVLLEGECKDGWCRVNEASIPQGFGFVEQGRLAF